MYFKTVLMLFTFLIVNPNGDSSKKYVVNENFKSEAIEENTSYDIPIGMYLNSANFKEEILLSTESKVILDNGSEIIE